MNEQTLLLFRIAISPTLFASSRTRLSAADHRTLQPHRHRRRQTRPRRAFLCAPATFRSFSSSTVCIRMSFATICLCNAIETFYPTAIQNVRLLIVSFFFWSLENCPRLFALRRTRKAQSGRRSNQRVARRRGRKQKTARVASKTTSKSKKRAQN